MNYLKFLIFILIFSSCSSEKEITKVYYTHISSTTSEQKGINYSIEIPKGFRLKVYKAGGEAGESREYRYLDSSVIYISDFGSSLNESNIEIGGYSSKKFDFSMKQNRLIGDSLILTGRTKSGYWKEINIGAMAVGYLNVSDQKKEVFDEALKTLKRTSE